eukprot:6139355-Amphidinium_carterae.1
MNQWSEAFGIGWNNKTFLWAGGTSRICGWMSSPHTGPWKECQHRRPASSTHSSVFLVFVEQA